MAAKLTPRSMDASRVRSRGRYVNVTVTQRLTVDVRALADYVGEETIENIRYLADKGRGYEGKFAALLPSTVERYDRKYGAGARQTKHNPSGLTSTIRRSGRLLEGLRYVLDVRQMRDKGARFRAGDMRVRVKVMGEQGRNRETGRVGALRPFLGLSTGDLRKIINRTPPRMAIKAVRVPRGQSI